MHNPYSQFNPAEPILRDQLAIDCSLPANERTLLSHLKSGVALFIRGVSIIHFSHEVWFTVTGFLWLPYGFFTVLFGASGFKRTGKAIAAARQEFKSIADEDETQG